ncbi:MAG: hypothetical protein ACI8RZ_007954, partial [Myxococcota bacterium]
MLSLLIGLAAAEQTITVVVAADVPVTASVRWLGADRTVPLSEQDGVWRGSLTGEDVRFLPVELSADGAVAYSGIEVVEAGDTTLAYGLHSTAPPVIFRQSAPLTPSA